jgi:hypothetical protein
VLNSVGTDGGVFVHREFPALSVELLKMRAGEAPALQVFLGDVVTFGVSGAVGIFCLSLPPCVEHEAYMILRGSLTC